VGLPTAYAGGDWDALLAAMRRDKKSRGDQLRFVVLEGIARPVRLEGPPDGQLRAAATAVGVAGREPTSR
jgi:3-dehydroquinate synthase